MLTFFRSALTSPWVLGLLGLVLIAFVVTGVSTRGMLGDEPRAAGAEVTSGDVSIAAPEVARRVQGEVAQLRQQNPTLDLPGLVAAGGVERTVAQMVDAAALERFGRRAGLVASRRMVDGEIASAAAFQDVTGKFDQNAFLAFLARERVTEPQVRKDIAGDLVRRQLLAPLSAAALLPNGVAANYAALLFEKRQGSVAFVPANAGAAGPAPSAAELQGFYRANLSRYTLPERRVLHYAAFDRARFAVQPSEADLRQAYQADAAKYGAVQTRSLTQVVLPSEADARAVAAKVKAGQSFAAAAGSNALPLGFKSREALAGLSSAAIADAVFALPKGATSEPAKSDFGWHVIHVDDVRTTAGKSFEQVRGEIATALAKTRTDEALGKFVGAIEDQLADGATFDDVAKAHGLAAVTTPPLGPDGRAGDQPAPRTPIEGPLAKEASTMTSEDDPVVATVVAGQNYALLQVGQVVGSAAQPFAAVQSRVLADFQAARARDRARTIAQAIVAKVAGGSSLAQAVAGAGAPLPPVTAIGGSRADLAQQGKPVPPAVRLLFNTVAGKARSAPAPDGSGWYVVALDRIERAPPASIAPLLSGARAQFSQLFQQELTQQFANAVRGGLSIKRNDRAVADIKAQLAGTAGAQ